MNLKNLLGGTRGEIAELLQHGPLTVSELAALLQLNPNGIRAHLTAMQGQGIVAPYERKPGVRKPYHLFSLSPSMTTSAAAEPVLSAFAETLSHRLDSADLTAAFEEAGAKLAAPLTGSFEERLSGVKEVLHGLGASVGFEDHERGVVIRGVKCPLAKTVDKCPEACAAVISLVGTLLDESVEKACVYDPHPMCGILVRRKTA